jgi:replicative DNA helicase
MGPYIFSRTCRTYKGKLMDDISSLILVNLVVDEGFTRKVIPFLKTEYFQEEEERLVFDLTHKFLMKYNKLPTKEALLIDLSNRENISQQVSEKSKAFIHKIEEKKVDPKWMLDQTEDFCKKRAIYNALMKSVEIYGDKTGKHSINAIPNLLQDALGVSFDTRLGHSFLDDYEARFKYYHHVEHKIPFDIDWLNLVTGGGVSKKTLNIVAGGQGGGKSLALCHFAAYNLISNRNVLFISLEMSEEEIAKRIDANILDIPIADLAQIPWGAYETKIGKLRSTTQGKLIIREFPNGSAGSANFRYLINELNLKQDFVPDVVYIDYMNICASSRVKLSSTRLDLYVKYISEELRGLAQEFNVPVLTANQFNKAGYTSSDPDLADNSDSFLSTAAADFTCAIINASEELSRLGQTLFKQTGKNRYYDITQNTRGVIGIDRSKMRLYNVDPKEQDGISGGTDSNTLIKEINKSFDKKSIKEFFS